MSTPDKLYVYIHRHCDNKVAYQNIPVSSGIDASDGKLYDNFEYVRAATISQLQAEISRYRGALTEIAEGFGPNHMSRYCQRVARTAIGGSNDKG